MCTFAAINKGKDTHRSFPSYKAFAFAFYLKIWQFLCTRKVK